MIKIILPKRICEAVDLLLDKYRRKASEPKR